MACCCMVAGGMIVMLLVRPRFFHRYIFIGVLFQVIAVVKVNTYVNPLAPRRSISAAKKSLYIPRRPHARHRF
jgi:hypothetical protein